MPIRIDGTNATANPGITGDDADTGFVFGTDQIEAVTGGTTRFTVENNGNVTIENGNLVLASGSGIDFSATADGTGTTNVNELLDDYEEGEWTPSWGASGTITTDSVARGFYTKIGDMCCVSVVVGSTGTPTLTDSILIEGLPYAPNEVQNITKYQGSFEAIYFNVNSTTQYSLSLTTSSKLVIREMTSGGGNISSQWNDVTNTNSFEVRGTLWYKVA